MILSSKGMKPEVIIHSFLFMQTVIFLRSHDFLLTSGVIRCHLRPAMCSHTYIHVPMAEALKWQAGRLRDYCLKKKRKKKKKKEFSGQIINTKKLYYFTNWNELCIICLGKTQISEGCLIPCHGFNFSKPDL